LWRSDGIEDSDIAVGRKQFGKLDRRNFSLAFSGVERNNDLRLSLP
jgi:hypothetical protein